MGFKVQVDPEFCIFSALLLLILPFRWILAMVTAMSFHEISHIVAIYLFGGRIIKLHIGAGGMQLDSSPLESIAQIICTLAGPAGSFLLLLLVHYSPEIALCGLVHGIYNMIPVYPLDGGRVIRFLLPERICIWIEYVVILLLFVGLGIATIVFHLGIGMLMPLIIVFWNLRNRKIPCIATKERVQ